MWEERSLSFSFVVLDLSFEDEEEVLVGFLLSWVLSLEWSRETRPVKGLTYLTVRWLEGLPWGFFEVFLFSREDFEEEDLWEASLSLCLWCFFDLEDEE